MSRKAVILEHQILTALGDLGETWNSLVEGRSGLAPFIVNGLPEAYPVGQITELEGKPGSARRLHSLLERLFALSQRNDNLFDESELILATTKGAADELLTMESGKLQEQCWQVGKTACQIFGCRDAVLTVSAACASGTIALIRAIQKIISGESDVVTVIGLDLVSVFVTAGFASLQALSPNGCKPFDRERDGLSLGEGAGFIILCSESYADNICSPPKAIVAGCGVSCDATHITAPSRTGSGLKQVIRQATGDGSVSIGAINAHGTGTVYNDAMELTAFRDIPGTPPPLHSIKGAIGHTLGGAGVIESSIAIHSLKEGCIPPTIGFNHTDDETARISGTSSLPLSCPTILSCNSGFGGINAGIIFAQPAG